MEKNSHIDDITCLYAVTHLLMLAVVECRMLVISCGLMRRILMHLRDFHINLFAALNKTSNCKAQNNIFLFIKIMLLSVIRRSKIFRRSKITIFYYNHLIYKNKHTSDINKGQQN